MEKEMANLTEKRRELGEQLSTSMEQCQSMKVKYNTDTKEWEEKVRLTYGGTYVPLYQTISFKVVGYQNVVKGPEQNNLQ